MADNLYIKRTAVP
jgi:hypothetical protein